MAHLRQRPNEGMHLSAPLRGAAGDARSVSLTNNWDLGV